jgi:hypothetical protein
MSGTENYDFRFTDNGITETITITVQDTTTTVSNPHNIGTVTGDGQSVVSISGEFDGHKITGMVGKGAEVQTGHGVTYDNTLFPDSNSGAVQNGDSGSSHGIDIYGIEFKIATGHGHSALVNLYEQNGQFYEITGNGNPTQITLDNSTYPCFCAGTRISTPSGYVNVEDLQVGDAVMTADGAVVPVRWIGRRAVDLRFADPISSLPIRIKAGALGNNLPVRDLLVSADHAMFIDGMLVQAGALVNGVTILRETGMEQRFTYYHIETPNHSLVLAEDAPTETFVDNVDRMAFDNWSEFEALAGERNDVAEMDYARVKSARQLPRSVRAKLSAVAARFVEAKPQAA